MKKRPALGPKGLIVEANVNPVCGMPLFSQARLLLVITVHDILTLLCSAQHSGAKSQFLDVALLCVISCTQYGTVSYRLCVVIRKIYVPTAQCTVQCALKVVVTREES